ncbi:hypothetical protein J2S13_000427 [Oikeobacillus pervagus]|uniref:DUF3906 domain-containing protein n=1 Tax=Oikeobacillus pervagus TaxID=1325931 RepID=A0AAJ1SYE3_9BACI|nr:DUF3906 family protein [Oikeobacillus pervagus]MDQ0214032.1 hypothetical protein [Oikeobacillus pervagus]
MNVYRFEVTTADQKVIPAVIVASTDEKAFSLVEVELEKYYLKLPDIENITLFEKKKLRNGGGFVVPYETNSRR